jgi:hypothetical protein
LCAKSLTMVNKCKECEGELIEAYNSGDHVCSACGLVDNTQDLVTFRYFPENFQEGPILPKGVSLAKRNDYERDSHMDEVNAQLQGGGGNVPEVIIKLIKKDYKRNGIPLSKVTREKTVEFLRKYGGFKYFEKWVRINKTLNKDMKIPSLTQQQIYMRNCMWKACKTSWPHCPIHISLGRKSMVPYQDLLKRIYLTLGLNESARMCKGCVTPHIIREHNAIWKWFAYRNKGDRNNLWLNWKRGIIPEGKIQRVQTKKKSHVHNYFIKVDWNKPIQHVKELRLPELEKYIPASA